MRGGQARHLPEHAAQAAPPLGEQAAGLGEQPQAAVGGLLLSACLVLHVGLMGLGEIRVRTWAMAIAGVAHAEGESARIHGFAG
jgi:hypothetical protein